MISCGFFALRRRIIRVQDAFLTETARLADVVLPAARPSGG